VVSVVHKAKEEQLTGQALPALELLDISKNVGATLAVAHYYT
jgi:hypothetical protein